MRIIKEAIVKDGEQSHCIVRSDSYGKSLKHIMTLVAAARADFPALTDEEMEVFVYLGRSYKNTRGVEFYTNKPVPDSYSRVESSEHAV